MSGFGNKNANHFAGDRVLLLREHIRHGFEDKTSETFLGTSRTACANFFAKMYTFMGAVRGTHVEGG